MQIPNYVPKNCKKYTQSKEVMGHVALMLYVHKICLPTRSLCNMVFQTKFSY